MSWSKAGAQQRSLARNPPPGSSYLTSICLRIGARESLRGDTVRPHGNSFPLLTPGLAWACTSVTARGRRAVVAGALGARRSPRASVLGVRVDATYPAPAPDFARRPRPRRGAPGVALPSRGHQRERELARPQSGHVAARASRSASTPIRTPVGVDATRHTETQARTNPVQQRGTATC